MGHSCFTTLTLLFLLSFIHTGLSLSCRQTEYPWPNDNPQNCCSKCPPGQYMRSRDKTTCAIDCRNCTGKRYTDSYNVNTCKICDDCSSAENMELVWSCNRTHNTVCRCKAGFTCANEACDSCVELPATTAAPTTTTTTTSTTAHITENQLRWFRRLLRKPQNLTGESVSEGGSPTLLFPPRFVFNREVRHTPPAPAKPIQDTAWFLIIISLLVLGIALVIVTKIKPLLSWFSQNKNYCLVVKPLSEPVTVVHVQEEKEEQQEEEDSVMVLDEACTPVQEMCGQCDLLKTETKP
ncbi:hypothetical protein WMY93_026527 [Mugilogobius chulae]|uniref:TNFR-Cys domain-containing protein n=1 Tax=Mugilogobius chulae TaxID=88201 RepID=A0AAW0MXT0_9GOBI